MAGIRLIHVTYLSPQNPTLAHQRYFWAPFCILLVHWWPRHTTGEEKRDTHRLALFSHCGNVQTNPVIMLLFSLVHWDNSEVSLVLFMLFTVKILMRDRYLLTLVLRQPLNYLPSPSQVDKHSLMASHTMPSQHSQPTMTSLGLGCMWV